MIFEKGNCQLHHVENPGPGEFWLMVIQGSLECRQTPFGLTFHNECDWATMTDETDESDESKCSIPSQLQDDITLFSPPSQAFSNIPNHPSQSCIQLN